MAATTKRELIKRVAERNQVQQGLAGKLIQSFLGAMIEELSRGQRLEFREFGIFDVVRRKARQARNPRTGTQVMVPSRTVVRFKPGRLMKLKVREQQPSGENVRA